MNIGDKIFILQHGNGIVTGVHENYIAVCFEPNERNVLLKWLAGGYVEVTPLDMIEIIKEKQCLEKLNS